MSTELKLLVWTLVLAVVQILLASLARTHETGLPYNASPRDTASPVPVGKLAGRLARAQANLFETLPIFIALVLIANVAAIHTDKTSLGTLIYFAARVAYVPLYAFGIPFVRSAAWIASLYGIILLFESLL